jgi:hypothetical protein
MAFNLLIFSKETQILKMEIFRIKFYPIQTTNLEIAVKILCDSQPTFFSKLIISERHAVDIGHKNHSRDMENNVRHLFVSLSEA